MTDMPGMVCMLGAGLQTLAWLYAACTAHAMCQWTLYIELPPRGCQCSLSTIAAMGTIRCAMPEGDTGSRLRRLTLCVRAGVVIGDIQNVMGVLYSATTFQGMFNLMNVLPVIGFERAIFYRYDIALPIVKHPCYMVTAALQLGLVGSEFLEF